jgi:hypothetical protein
MNYKCVVFLLAERSRLLSDSRPVDVKEVRTSVYSYLVDSKLNDSFLGKVAIINSTIRLSKAFVNEQI